MITLTLKLKIDTCKMNGSLPKSNELAKELIRHIKGRGEAIPGLIININSKSDQVGRADKFEQTSENENLPVKKVFSTAPYVIAKIVFDYFKTPLQELFNQTRKRDKIIPRQVSQYFTKQLNGERFSLVTIGELLGNQDHATCLNSFRTVNNLIETDCKFRSQIDEIEKRIKG